MKIRVICDGTDSFPFRIVHSSAEDIISENLCALHVVCGKILSFSTNDLLPLQKNLSLQTMRSFALDNSSGVHSVVMEALAQVNQDHALGYGDDSWTKEAVRKIKETFVADCEPLFVFNGTGSNVIALQLLTCPYSSIICAETAHIHVDECGSPVKITGCQIRPVATPDGKLTPELIAPYLHGFGDQHHSQSGAVYLSEYTGLGTIYAPEELRAITSLAHQRGMQVYMDGARIANACAALGLSLKALTVDCGIDALSFGGTKNELMMGECVITFDDSLKVKARFIRK